MLLHTLGLPKRLNRSSVTSRMRSAVRRGAFLAMAQRGASQRRLHRVAEVVHHFLQRRDGAAYARGRAWAGHQVPARIVQHVGAQADAVPRPAWSRRLVRRERSMRAGLLVGVLGQLAVRP